VSNFGVQDLETLLASAKIRPAANQAREHMINTDRRRSNLLQRSCCIHMFTSGKHRYWSMLLNMALLSRHTAPSSEQLSVQLTFI
jgi:hypothetical protein